MQGVLYVQIVLFKLQCLLNVLGTLFLNICYGKFCFVNYLVNKKTLTPKIKKRSSVTRTIKYSLDYTVMVSFFLLTYSFFIRTSKIGP